MQRQGNSLYSLVELYMAYTYILWGWDEKNNCKCQKFGLHNSSSSWLVTYHPHSSTAIAFTKPGIQYPITMGCICAGGPWIYPPYC